MSALVDHTSDHVNNRTGNDLPAQPDQQGTACAPECAPLTVEDWLDACPVELPESLKAGIAGLIRGATT